MYSYYDDLRKALLQEGYAAVKYEEPLFFIQEQEERILLLRVLSEPLPGQNPPSLENVCKCFEKEAKMCMIRSGKRVERLLLVVRPFPPNAAVIEAMDRHEEIWYLDRRSGRLFLYEHQKTEFYGLRAFLENFSVEYEKIEKISQKARRKDTLTPINTLLIVLNLLVFFACSILVYTGQANALLQAGSMSYPAFVEEGEYYRLFTSMFLHFDARHVMENMLMLLLTGRILERYMGKGKYLLIYIGAGLVSSVTSLLFTLWGQPNVISAGASGAICGVLGGLLFVILEKMVRRESAHLENLSVRGILLLILCCIGYGFTMTDVDNAAHVGGLIGGFVLTGMMECVRTRRNRRKIRKK